SLDESVGSPPSWVILFGDIPTIIPSTSVVARETSTIAPVISSAAPVVETTVVTSPTGLYGLVPYSGSDSDSPDEIKVASRPSSSYEFPISPVTAPLGIHRRSAILIRPGKAILFGRPYRTHLNGPRKLLTVRKRVGPLPAHRLAWRHASPRSSDHHLSSSSSSSDSSPVHSLGLDAPDQAHSGSSTRDVSPRLGYPPRRAPVVSSSVDSSERPLHSSSHFARPSCKRCRSLVDSVPSSTLVMGSLALTHADLLPPRKRFRDSYSSEASIEEDTEIDPIETEVNMKLGIGDGDDVRDHVEIDPRDVKDDTEEYEADTSAGDTVEVGIDPMSAPIVKEEIVEPAGEDSSNSSGTRDGIVRIVGIETVQRRLEADQLIARGQRVSMVERIGSLRLENLKVYAMLDIERDRVNSLQLHMSLLQEEFRQVYRDRDDTQGRLRRTMTNTRFDMTPAAIEEMINQHVDTALEARRVNRDLELGIGNDNEGDGNGDGTGNGTRNGNNGGNNGDGNENRNVNRRGDRPVAHECTYQDFMKCQPLGFKGTEGVVGLIRWSEKMETVFHISNCLERYQVKYATCTLLDSAFTWWNSHKRTIGTNDAYVLSWRELLKLMTEVYCPRNEIQKMETELWNFLVKNNDMATYNQSFQELTMICTKMVPEEEDRVEKFIGGLPDNIQGNVIAAEPTRLQDAVRIANNLMDQKLKGYVNVARAYMAGNNEKNGYEGTLSFCNKCKLHHEGHCIAKCCNCKRIGHLARDCRSVVTVTTQGTLGLNQVAFDLLRDALSAIFGLSELKAWDARDALGYILDCTLKDLASDEEIEEPMKDHPLPTDASPTALSPGYIADSDPEEDEEDDEESLPPPEGVQEGAPSSGRPFYCPLKLRIQKAFETDDETMTTVDQGMSVEEIERVIAERVANAIEAIAIYETKTNMARKSISQTEQQECKVAGNANNKRKWEGNHNGQCTIKDGNCKKVGHMTRECRNPTAARNQQTHTCYKCGSQRHFKSKCPIVNFQKHVDKKISTLFERQAENKRKLNNTSKDNQNQQQPNKRQNTGKAYAAGHGEKKYYGGSKPLCPKCNYHHDGPCPPKCHRCNIVGHLVRNCRRPTNDNTANNQRGTGTSQKVNCYECGNQGHYRRDCPERKNQSHKNQIGGTGAHGVVHTLREGGNRSRS
ncbi:putative reverse transcriptase domain-containing protein, partial [Tanacetum coccineum]